MEGGGRVGWELEGILLLLLMFRTRNLESGEGGGGHLPQSLKLSVAVLDIQKSRDTTIFSVLSGSNLVL